MVSWSPFPSSSPTSWRRRLWRSQEKSKKRVEKRVKMKQVKKAKRETEKMARV
jgi:hypothetical protein